VDNIVGTEKYKDGKNIETWLVIDDAFVYTLGGLTKFKTSFWFSRLKSNFVGFLLCWFITNWCHACEGILKSSNTE